MFLQDGCILFVNGFDLLFDGVIMLDVQYMDIVMCSVGFISLCKLGGEVSDYLFWESGVHVCGYACQFDVSVEVIVIVNDNFGSWCLNISDSFGGGNNGMLKGVNMVCFVDFCMGVLCNSVPVSSCNVQGNVVVFVNFNFICMVNVFGNLSCDYQVMEMICDLNMMCCMNGVCEMLFLNLFGVGDVIFIEFLGNLIGDDNIYEWIEFYNMMVSEISLFLMFIEDNEVGGVFMSWSIMDQNVVIFVNGYVIFVLNIDSVINGGFIGVYQLVIGLFKNVFDLDVNGQSVMCILFKFVDGIVIDEVYYGIFVEGVLQQFFLSVYVGMGVVVVMSNDGVVNFCDVIMLYDVGIGIGFFGVVNEVCL